MLKSKPSTNTLRRITKAIVQETIALEELVPESSDIERSAYILANLATELEAWVTRYEAYAHETSIPEVSTLKRITALEQLVHSMQRELEEMRDE